jgi:hypothetical protein
LPSEAVYYYGIGEDTYPVAWAHAASEGLLGDNVTVTTAGNITAIGIKTKYGSTYDMYVSLFYDDGGTWTLHECGTIQSNLLIGWNDYTLTTPYAVDSSESVLVVMQPVTNAIVINRSGDGTGGLITTETNYCAATISVSDGQEMAVRVKVE